MIWKAIAIAAIWFAPYAHMILCAFTDKEASNTVSDGLSFMQFAATIVVVLA